MKLTTLTTILSTTETIVAIAIGILMAVLIGNFVDAQIQKRIEADQAAAAYQQEQMQRHSQQRYSI